MDTTQKALNQYNSKWAGSNYETSKLYRKATNAKTAQYGCRLQDHVLALMGGNGKIMKRIGKAAQAWVDWMLK